MQITQDVVKQSTNFNVPTNNQHTQELKAQSLVYIWHIFHLIILETFISSHPWVNIKILLLCQYMKALYICRSELTLSATMRALRKPHLHCSLNNITICVISETSIFHWYFLGLEFCAFNRQFIRIFIHKSSTSALWL